MAFYQAQPIDFRLMASSGSNGLADAAAKIAAGIRRKKTEGRADEAATAKNALAEQTRTEDVDHRTNVLAQTEGANKLKRQQQLTVDMKETLGRASNPAEFEAAKGVLLGRLDYLTEAEKGKATTHFGGMDYSPETVKALSSTEQPKINKVQEGSESVTYRGGEEIGRGPKWNPNKGGSGAKLNDLKVAAWGRIYDKTANKQDLAITGMDKDPFTAQAAQMVANTFNRETMRMSPAEKAEKTMEIAETLRQSSSRGNQFLEQNSDPLNIR